MEHQSLVYGADWCRVSAADLPLTDSESVISETRPCSSCDADVARDSVKTSRLVSTCSFYDCQAHLWTVTLE